VKEWYLKHQPQIMTAMVVIFSLLAIAIIVLLVLSSYSKKKQEDHLRFKKRKCYIFTIYMEQRNVVFFERTNPKEQTSMTLDFLYKHILNPKERDLFREWLENLFVDNHNLLSEIVLNFDGKQILSLFFTVDSLNIEKKIIHLCSYNVEYLQDSLKKRKYFMAPLKEMHGVPIDSIYTKKNTVNGALIFVRFFPLDKRLDEAKQNAIANELRQVILLFIKEKRSRSRIEFDDSKCFVILDVNTASLAEKQQTVFQLIKKLNSRLEINSCQEDFDFSIGVAELKYFTDGKKCLEVARNKAMAAERQDSKMEWYSNGDSVKEFGEEVWEQELDNAIHGKKKDRRLQFLYAPLVQATLPAKMFGYITYVEPENSEFHSFEEMKIKANEYNRNYELLSLTSKTLINKFYNEVVKRFIESGQENNLRLFLPVMIYDKDLILKVLSEIRHTKDCHVVIMMDENDMNEIVSKNYEEAIEYLKLIKKKKYEIALALKSSNLTWANGVYEVFDYFVIDKTLTSGKESLDSSSAIKRLSTKLTVFQKPLIALDMTTKAMIQILRERGFFIFGGNAIEMRSEDIVELTPRKMSVVRK
jgi:hypothetical protein